MKGFNHTKKQKCFVQFRHIKENLKTKQEKITKTLNIDIVGLIYL